jgi:hypothetical protein
VCVVTYVQHIILYKLFAERIGCVRYSKYSIYLSVLIGSQSLTYFSGIRHQASGISDGAVLGLVVTFPMCFFRNMDVGSRGLPY